MSRACEGMGFGGASTPHPLGRDLPPWLGRAGGGWGGPRGAGAGRGGPGGAGAASGAAACFSTETKTAAWGLCQPPVMSIPVIRLEMGEMTTDWVWIQWTHFELELDLDQNSTYCMVPKCPR